MRTAYLIDPFAREVTRVTLETQAGSAAELEEIYRLLDCGIIEAVTPVNAQGDVIFVDEEGKVANSRRTQQYFLCRLWPYEPLAGKALWIGSTPNGEVVSARSELSYVAGHIVWSRTA
jgi:hypothetical protein